MDQKSHDKIRSDQRSWTCVQNAADCFDLDMQPYLDSWTSSSWSGSGWGTWHRRGQCDNPRVSSWCPQPFSDLFEELNTPSRFKEALVFIAPGGVGGKITHHDASSQDYLFKKRKERKKQGWDRRHNLRYSRDSLEISGGVHRGKNNSWRLRGAACGTWTGGFF